MAVIRTYMSYKDLNDIRSHLAIADELFFTCGNCGKPGIELKKDFKCPSCGTSFKYIAFRGGSLNPSFIEKKLKAMEDLGIKEVAVIDYGDYNYYLNRDRASKIFS